MAILHMTASTCGLAGRLWNFVWLVDLVRFTRHPLRPHKVFGIPLALIYHVLTWPLALIIAAPRAAREQSQGVGCRTEARLLGLLFSVFLVATYIELMGRYRGTSNQGRMSEPVRAYVREQAVHCACLALYWSGHVMWIAVCEAPTSWQGVAYRFVLVSQGWILGLSRLLVAAGWLHGGARPEASRAVRIQESELVTYLPSGVTALTSGPMSASATLVPASGASSYGGMTTPRTLTDDLLSPNSFLPVRQMHEETNYSYVDFEVLLGWMVKHFKKQKVLSDGMGPQSTEQERANHLQWLYAACAEETHGTEAVSCVVPRPGFPEVTHFGFTAYEPWTFVYLRAVFGVDIGHLLRELDRCNRKLNAQSLQNAAKSGSLLLKSEDGAFMMKTLPNAEVLQLRSILPGYRDHMRQKPGSFLTEILGLFTYTNHSGSNLNVVLMSCLTEQATGILGSPQVFDVKSEFSDDAFCKCFPSGLQLLSGDARDALCGNDRGLSADCTFLAGEGLVDYSVLVCLWEVSASTMAASAESCSRQASSADSVASTLGARGRGLGPGLGRRRGLGLGLAGGGSQALWRASAPPAPALPALPSAPRRFFLLRVGVIDFLVAFGKQKFLESAMKRFLKYILHPRESRAGESVTVIQPSQYARRQLEFVRRSVFPEHAASASPVDCKVVEATEAALGDA